LLQKELNAVSPLCPLEEPSPVRSDAHRPATYVTPQQFGALAPMVPIIAGNLEAVPAVSQAGGDQAGWNPTGSADAAVKLAWGLVRIGELGDVLLWPTT